jgi:hypothetical protein
MDINTKILNNFEKHLRNGHTQTPRHTEPPSCVSNPLQRLIDTKKDTIIKPP